MSKKRLILSIVGISLFIAIAITTYLLFIGQPVYRLLDIKKDDIVQIEITKFFSFGGGRTKAISKVYRIKDKDKTDFNKANAMLQKLRLGITSNPDNWMLAKVGGSIDDVHYKVRITTKDFKYKMFAFFEDDPTKIEVYKKGIHFYRKGLFSKLDMNQFTPEQKS